MDASPRPIRACPPITLRPFRVVDSFATYRIFFDAVHMGTSEKYSACERAAWAGSDRPPANWTARLKSQLSYVAAQDGRIAGFMSMEDTGYVDMAYVHPKHHRMGIATRLHGMLEARAHDMRLRRMTAEVSLVAEPFFLRMGWQILSPHARRVNGVRLANLRMQKALR